MSKNQISRRSFLQTTAGSAGAMIAAKRIVLQPENIPSKLEMTAPSDRIRFGIIGVGMQGNGLLSTAVGLPGSRMHRRRRSL